MSDIFQEVEEEVRRERFEKIWKQYGDYIIAGLALVVIAIVGWQLYAKYQANERLKASEGLAAAQSAASGGDMGKAAPMLALLAKDAPGGYAILAKFSQADILIAAGQRDAAIGIYKDIAAKNAGPLGEVALLRAAWASVDATSRNDMEAMLAKLNKPANPWRFAAREILAYSDFHAGLAKQAQADFKALSDDKDAPEQLRRRAAAMAQFLANGGVTNYGTVPQPPAPPAAPPTPGAPAGTPATAAAGATPTPPAPAPNGTPKP